MKEAARRSPRPSRTQRTLGAEGIDIMRRALRGMTREESAGAVLDQAAALAAEVWRDTVVVAGLTRARNGRGEPELLAVAGSGEGGIPSSEWLRWAAAEALPGGSRVIEKDGRSAQVAADPCAESATVFLVCLHPARYHPVPGEMDLLAGLAETAGLALRTLGHPGLSPAAPEVVVLAERERIAREIHDGVAQSLFTLALQVEICLKSLRDEPQAMREMLQQARTIASRCLTELRGYLSGLRGHAMERLGLVPSLRKYVGELNRSGIVTATLGVEGTSPELNPALEEDIYRVAQEALTNTLRHAQSAAVDVRLVFAGGEVVLCVQDFGRGFDPSGLPAPRDRAGIGLASMEDRIVKRGGRFELWSETGKGTRITAVFPATARGD